MNELPMWAKLIAYLGFPIAVASLLLFKMGDQFDQHNLKLDQHNANVAVHLQQTREHAEQMKQAVESFVYVLQVQCQHQAATKKEIDECLIKP